MFAVTGATGKLGRLVVEQLAKRVPAEQIVAAVRRPERAQDLAALGVQVRHADYDKPSTLAAALHGATRLLLISGNVLGKRLGQHRAVIEAAERAGVQLLAYTSMLRAGSSELLLANEHRETELLIRKSALPFVLLRNGWYFESYIEQLEYAPVKHGKILGSAQQGRIAAAARGDYAEAAAIVLTAGTAPREVYELAGDTAFTLAELAAEITRVTGRSVKYQDLPPSAYREALIGADVPALEAELLVDVSVHTSRGALDDDTRMLSQLLGRPTRSLAEVLRTLRAAQR